MASRVSRKAPSIICRKCWQFAAIMPPQRAAKRPRSDWWSRRSTQVMAAQDHHAILIEVHEATIGGHCPTLLSAGNGRSTFLDRSQQIGNEGK